MSDKKAVFTFEGTDLIIQCSGEDKMKDIFQKYCTKVDKNIDTLLFLSKGRKIIFDLSFNEQAIFSDRSKRSEIKILVKKNEKKTR